MLAQVRPDERNGRSMIEPHDAVAAAAPGKAKVITFPPSLDCELSRFPLRDYGVQCEEQRHTVPFSFFHTLLHGTTLYFPLLYGDGYRPLKNVREMIDFFDARCPAGRNLLLSGRERDSVEADWTQFNATLGGATAAFAYFHFLPHRAIMIRPLSEGTPAYEVEAVRWAYPLFARFLRMALKLSASAARGALGQVRQVVQSVDARLADGRRYLVGDRFSLSDMALGINWATPCLARECGGALPGFGPT